MTVGKFSDQQDTALRLIAANGERATITRKVRTPGAQPWKPGASTTSTYAVDAAFIDPPGSGRAGRERDGASQVPTEEKVALLPASGLTIEPSPTTDRITRVDGTTYEIVKVQKLAPNEDTILYRLTLKR